jgi:hypothetical protein
MHKKIAYSQVSIKETWLIAELRVSFLKPVEVVIEEIGKVHINKLNVTLNDVSAHQCLVRQGNLVQDLTRCGQIFSSLPMVGLACSTGSSASSEGAGVRVKLSIPKRH